MRRASAGPVARRIVLLFATLLGQTLALAPAARKAALATEASASASRGVDAAPRLRRGEAAAGLGGVVLAVAAAALSLAAWRALGAESREADAAGDSADERAETAETPRALADGSLAAAASKAVITSHPRLVLAVLAAFSALLAAAGRPLARLRSTTSPLTAADASLLEDFPLVRGRIYEAVVVWCTERAAGACDVRRDSSLSQVQAAVHSSLGAIRSDLGSCVSLAWEPSAWLPSADSLAVSLPVQMGSVECLDRVRAQLRDGGPASSSLNVALGGATALAAASMEAADEAMFRHVMISLPLVTLFLWHFFGGLARALSPLLCLGLAIVCSRAGVVWARAAKADLNVDYQTLPVVFVSFAFSMDYALFYWARLRKFRRAGIPYADALALSLRRTGPVIIMSTSIICLAYGGTLAFPGLNESGWRGMYIHQILAVALVGAYSCTLPPALAALFPSMFDEAKGAPSDGHERATLWTQFWSTWANTVTSRPINIIVPLAVLGFTMLSFTALPAYEPNYDLMQMGTVRGTPEHEAYEVLLDKFFVGETMPTVVVFQPEPLQATPPGSSENYDLSGVAMSPEFGRAVCSFSDALLSASEKRNFQIVSISSLWANAAAKKSSAQRLRTTCSAGGTPDAQLLKAYSSPDQRRQLLLVSAAGAPTGQVAVDMSKFLRDTLTATAGTFSVGGTQFRLGAAQSSVVSVQLEAADAMNAASAVVWGLTCMVVFAAVGIVYRSLFVPAKLILTVIVPIVSVFGLVIGVYQLGWLNWTGWKVVESTGGLPYNTVYLAGAVLFGLAMDYDLFLFSRVYEYRMEGYENTSAVRLALCDTGPVITVAGLLMAYSFWFIMLSQMACIRVFGFLLFAGVCMDTFVIRTCLVPGVLTLVAKLNYWPGEVPPESKSCG